ncbi:MAG: HAD-IC family P-type ATPase [Candidatus Dojkabacteria bacterium]
MSEQITGLTKSEVEKRSREGRVNVGEDPQSKSIVLIVFSNLIDLPNAIIFISIGFLILFDQVKDAFLVSLVIITNMIISIVQEIKARNSIKQINFLNPEKVTVVRDGQDVEIKPEEIVVDDVIKLESGKYLHVDGDIINEEALSVDESILSGESEYAKKEPGDRLLSGSFIVAGKGYYSADSVGNESFVNKITTEARSYISYLSPLQARVNLILKTLTYITIAVIAVLLTINTITSNSSEVEIVNAIVSVINSMVPQGIVLSVTIAFVLGALRMARKKIIVQKANTIETLASIKVLCMDKTGTITENKLKMEDFINLADGERASELTSVFCNNTLEQNKTILAIRDGLNGKPRGKDVKVLKQIPFTSRRKLSGLDIVYKKQRYQLLLGSLDSLGSYTSEKNREVLSSLETKYASLGRRNLVILYRKVKTSENSDIERQKKGFDTLAFISLEDKLRRGAKSIIDSFINQEIKPVIISGDHPETLRALISQLNIPSISHYTSGKELENKNQADFDEVVISNDVFARVTPEQKVEIIKSYQKVYGYVAMIGDGVNDALAIKQANLGVAMGSGANVTKKIADIILIDDNIAKLADVVEQGRIILANTLRATQLLVVKNVYSLILIVGTLFLGLLFPFYPLGLFYLAFINGSLPVIWVILDKPKLRSDAINFLPNLYRFIFSGGLLAGLIGLIFIYLYTDIYSQTAIRGVILSFLILCGMVNYLSVINNSFSIPQMFSINRNIFIALIGVVLYLGGIAIAPVRDLFRLYVLDERQWTMVLMMALVYLVLFSITNRLLISRTVQT